MEFRLLLSVYLFLIISDAAFGQVTNFELGDLSEPNNVEVKLLHRDHEDPQSSTKTPVVFWHGMGDTAFGSINIDRLALEKRYPGMSVFSIQIGSNSLEDELAGYFVNANTQIASTCEKLLQNKLIRQHGSFNAIGFSQGAQFMRGLIQRCPFRANGIKVKNFISLGGQHQGVFGLPNCMSSIFCEQVRQYLTDAVYQSNVQEHVVQAEYWHDPKREDEYRTKNVFLADINNEIQVNETYRSNLLALDNMVLVKFEHDDMVIPKESSHFGFYKVGQTKELFKLEESRLYLDDRLGLKQLKESGRLHQLSVPGNHLQYKMSWFLDSIAAIYLDN